MAAYDLWTWDGLIMKRSGHSLLVAIAVLLTGFTYGQDATSDPQASIAKLLNGLQKAAVSGAPVSQFFSPNARISERETIESLQAKGFTKFEFADYTLKDLQFQDPEHATLPVTVKYSTRNEESSKTTTLRFVRDQGAWYFAKADFWQVSFLWFFPMIAYGASYGCGVVIMYWHSNRQQWANVRKKVLWQGLALAPFSFFFYFARKPWATS
jgi:hypothetical protein